ncbi:unnamed protein product [Pocillopora meandrina]|uniref:RanBP2-type domain-containing protein n=1 Tax=Pocillopora meandrina TaxID=46732 RepID=A0AAU9W2P2_9CNID|nr:unnamed protein product [Pocillopora meandrina]
MDWRSLPNQYIEYHSNDANETKEKVLVRNSKEFLSTSEPGYRFAPEVKFYDDVERIAQKFESDEDFFKMMKAGINSLEKCGVNLWRFPWCKEYHTVKLYTEFLKNIEKQLKDKEFIFSVLKFLGYTERDEHKVYIKDSGRRNPIWASFNLFLLQVELQIMEEIQSQNSSRNIPSKEIVRARSKRRTVEEAIRYLDLKFSSKQPELDKRQGDDVSSYGLTRGTSNSGAVGASNRSDEHTVRNGYVPTAQLPHHKLPLGGVDWEQITDNVLYGVNPEESQPERASVYNWEVHDQTSLSSRYPCRCDDFRRSATTREKTGSSQHVTTPPTGRPQYSVNTKEGQQHDADSSYYTFHQLGVPRCPCLTNVGVKDPEVTGNSQHVTTPPTGRPQYSANTKEGQQHDADSSYYTFHQLGVPRCPCLTNVGVKDSEVTVQPALLNNGHSFNSSARAGASVHGINTRYANFGCNIGSDSQNIGCSGSYKSLSTKEGERRFEDRLPIIQETYISRSSKGLIGLEGETHVRSSNHFSSNDEPSNVSKAAKAPQQQKNMSSGHRRQEHIPSAEEAAKSRQAHRSQVNIESPVAPTGVFNVSSGATVQNRTNGDSTRKVDGSACHSSPFQVQNPTQDSVKGPQTGAVSVAQTTLPHEARAVEQAKKVENGLCEHCLLPASCICRSCHQLVCGKCKKVYSVDICAVTKGEHEFANLKASEGKGKDEQGIGISGEEWSCLRCTYVNPVENKICAICSTTRGLGAVELSKPGSRVCSSCTFHNKENAKICSACFRHLDLNFFETKI